MTQAQRPPGLPAIPAGPPLLIVLSGPSGAGKDAVRDLLMAWQLPVHFAVTAATRERRPDEQDGIDYHFISDEAFDRLVAEDGLIEHAIVYGQKKGIPRTEVLGPLASGQDVLVRVDVQGAATLRTLVPDALLIFIAPPSEEEEQRRLVGRATESPEQLQTRLETSAQEMAAAGQFDHVIVNATGALQDTARRVVELIVAEKGKRANGP
jgi:guanylate kinase